MHTGMCGECLGVRILAKITLDAALGRSETLPLWWRGHSWQVVPLDRAAASGRERACAPAAGGCPHRQWLCDGSWSNNPPEQPALQASMAPASLATKVHNKGPAFLRRQLQVGSRLVTPSAPCHPLQRGTLSKSGPFLSSLLP